MKLLGSTKSKITKDKKNGENVPYLEITEVVLIHCNIVNNSYEQNSRVLYTFVPNKSFSQLLYISPENLIFLKTFDSEFLYIEVSLTDQNSNPLEIEDKISITLVINKRITYKITCYSVQPRERVFVKGYGFLSFVKNMGRNVSSVYSQKLIDHATDAFETASKRSIQKTAEATEDLIGNKIADKITRSSKTQICFTLFGTHIDHKQY